MKRAEKAINEIYQSGAAPYAPRSHLARARRRHTANAVMSQALLMDTFRASNVAAGPALI